MAFSRGLKQQAWSRECYFAQGQPLPLLDAALDTFEAPELDAAINRAIEAGAEVRIVLPDACLPPAEEPARPGAGPRGTINLFSLKEFLLSYNNHL